MALTEAADDPFASGALPIDSCVRAQKERIHNSDALWPAAAHEVQVIQVKIAAQQTVLVRVDFDAGQVCEPSARYGSDIQLRL